MHRDIFKDVVDLVCCNYISDLRFLVKEVYQKIHKINFKEYDIDNRIIDTTPSFSTTRGEEIKRWLFDNKERVNNYVILDDEDDMIDLRNHLVLCDDYYGFNYKAKIEAEKILKRSKL